MSVAVTAVVRLTALFACLALTTSLAHGVTTSLDPQLKLARSRPGRTPLSVRVLVYSAAPIGAYTLQVSFDATALELTAVDGGTNGEFSAAPIVDPAAFATGTLRASAFQAHRLDGPTGKVHVVTLRFRPRATSGAAGRTRRSTAVTVEATTLATTQGGSSRPPPRRIVLRY